jgi:DNA-binding beta-propeller fold protein YncE
LSRTRLAVIVLVASVAVLGAGAVAESESFSVSLQFGSAGSGPGQFNGPTAVAVEASTGDVYVIDTHNDRVEKFSSSGSYIAQFGNRGSGPDQLMSPKGVAIDSANGDLYVVDGAQVQEFDPSGAYVTRFGSMGTGPGQFMMAQRLAFDPLSGDVYVTDSALDRVEVFDSAGDFVSQFGSQGAGAGQFSDPFGIAADPQTGDVYVTDGNGRIEQFSSSGTYLSQFGSQGSGNGQLMNPTGVAVDPSNGNVYVADHSSSPLKEFDSSGRFLGQIQTSFSPDSLAVDPSTGDILASDFSNDRVVRFSLTAPPPPVSGRSVDVAPVAGTVLIKPPGATMFVTLEAGQQISLGSTLDATGGIIALSAVASRGQVTTGRFYAGVFRVSQQPTPLAELTVLTLAGPKPSGCAAADASAKRKPARSRSLWGSANGDFRTVGSYASATERGTKWLTQDTCAGTRIRVAQGAVTVDDFPLHRTFVLSAPHSYLARPAKAG